MNGNTPTARLLRVYSRRSKQQSTKSPPEAADSSEGALKDYNANMPGKKRSRGRKKKSSESQPKQTASTPSVPASTVKPAQYEKGTASSSSAAVAAAKLETSTTATTRSTSTAATSSVTNVGASTGAKVSGGVTTTTGSSKVTPQVKSEVSAKASTPEKKMPAGQPEKPKEVSKPVTLDEAVDSLSAGFVSSPPPGASKPEVKHENVVAADSRKNYAPAPPAQKKQDVSVPTSLSPAPPADKKPKIEKPAKDSATAAAQDVKAKAEEKKISADKLQQGPKDVPMSPDPFDALSNTLPEAKPVPEPKKLRPEEIVDEKKLKSEKGVRVGEREDSLPPEYRHKPDKDMKQPPPPPPKQPSMDTTEALDILSGDFTDATVAPVVQSPVPPKAQDKQPKVEDLSALDALAGDFVAPVKGQKVCSGAPPAPPSTTKSTPPTSEQVDPMALDALDTLGDLLPKAKPAPESPKLRPEQIVEEAKLKSEKGVRVGERDDTLPPGYRFPKTDPKSQPPPPKKEPSMDPTEALDILSGDFTCAQAAPVVQACVRPSAPPASASMDFDLEELSGDFVAPKSASKVCSAATTTDKQADPMSLDALDVLGDSLPKAKPTPMSPILRPEEIVNEATLKSEKGVRVGERDDTLPPGYRFPKTDPKSQPPPPKKEPSMDPTEALDILSGDFTCAQAAPVVQACVRPSAPPASSSADFDLEELAGDFVAPTSASKVCSASSAPTAMDRQLSDGSSSAMDALSDTLKDIHPAPEPARVSPKDVVKEKDVVEERLHKPGERDDSLPPEFRPTEADIKAAAEAKGKAAAKKPSFDDAAALDALSSDFVSVVPGTSPAPQCQAPSVNTSSSQKKPGPVMDQLAASLLPADFPSTKQSDSKPKAKGRKSKSASKKPAAADAPAVETLPAKPSSDVVSTSTTKKGGKS
ncbi:calpastatin isoform X18 [Tachysurus fulvidraco]|uniref:calpastatin isoform X18 n=1 Tax=Tachysurus fulvidraco TaxID=1234273 RepID=UPI001FEE3FE7|nr:calpastatin isoform X18 [Tachysurus fulvidraco]